MAEKKQITLVLKEPPKRKAKTEYSLFSSVVRGRYARKSYLKNNDRVKVMRLRSLLEKKRLLNTIEKMKLKQQLENIKRKGKPIVMKAISPIRQEPFFANPHTNDDLFSAFNADMGHGDNLFRDEKYYDEDYYTENYYDEDFFGDAGIDWGKLRRKEGNPLFW